MRRRAKLWEYGATVQSDHERAENLSRLQFVGAAAIVSTREEAHLKCPDWISVLAT